MHRCGRCWEPRGCWLQRRGGRQGGERVVDASLAARVLLVIGLGGHVADQFFQVSVVTRQDRVLSGGLGAEHDPLTVGVQQHQLSEGGSHRLRNHHCGVDGGQPLRSTRTEIEGRVVPAADDPVVPAAGALPLDGPLYAVAKEGEATGAGSPTGLAMALQCA